MTEDKKIASFESHASSNQETCKQNFL